MGPGSHGYQLLPVPVVYILWLFLSPLPQRDIHISGPAGPRQPAVFTLYSCSGSGNSFQWVQPAPPICPVGTFNLEACHPRGAVALESTRRVGTDTQGLLYSIIQGLVITQVPRPYTGFSHLRLCKGPLKEILRCPCTISLQQHEKLL